MQAWDVLKRPIWMFDPVALRGVYANAAALDLWGSDNLDALLARDFSNVSPPSWLAPSVWRARRPMVRP